MHETSSARNNARSLRHSIAELSELRRTFTRAHELAHSELSQSEPVNPSPVSTDKSGSRRPHVTFKLKGPLEVGGTPQPSPADTDSAKVTLGSTAYPSPWSNALSGLSASELSLRSGDTLWAEMAPSVGRDLKRIYPLLVRLIDGKLAALFIALTVLSRHPNALSFVLVMLAACLRYGRREEPDDHAPMPMREKRTSVRELPAS